MLLAFISLLLSACCVNPILAASPDVQGSSLTEGQESDAIASLKKAIEQDPKEVRAYLDLATAYMRKNDAVSADAILRQAVAANPNSIDAHLALGDLRLISGKLNDAETEYKEALDIQPESDMLHLKLGGFYQIVHKWAEAEATYQRWAALKPADEKPKLALGDFYVIMGQGDKALAAYEQARAINPTVAREKIIEYYLNAKKPDEAERLVKELLAKNTKDGAGRFYQARLLMARGKPSDAIEVLQGVLKDDPKSARAHHLLGLAFAEKNELARARMELTEAVKLAPNSSQARTALAQVFLAERAFDQAIEQAQAAIRLNARNLLAAVILGDAYLRKGKPDKAKQVYEALAKAAPKESLSHYKLGVIARMDKHDARALAEFEQALQLNPNAIEPLAQIVEIHVAQGKLKEARERVARQLEASPENLLVRNLLGLLWVASKDTDRAEAEFKRAIDINPTYTPSYMNLADLYQRAGKLDKAIKEYEAALAQNASLLSAHVLLGAIYEQRKAYDKARAHYETALKVNPTFGPAANNLAWLIGEHGGDLDTAITYAQIAREQLPEDPQVADTLGWLYYWKKSNLKAVALLKEAADKLPGNPIVLYHYGMAEHQSGNAAAAKTLLQSSLKLSDTYPGAEEAKKVLATL